MDRDSLLDSDCSIDQIANGSSVGRAIARAAALSEEKDDSEVFDLFVSFVRMLLSLAPILNV
ncbi:uncharacterized protein N7479_005976 [Penicillium vulpinum]|uniref:uncharacterized protein n=1 Tax=Penicillium vulpinum TaxID=29845 RepID=UPI0025469D30|nr:uncharacterized protein N7479_005976 [Penicillium vulpinum]KAJ5958826.1 hypothetical protein N7479_005976 [Penicillium vulpinum]